MAKGARFKLNHAGVGEMLKSSETREKLNGPAQAALGRMQGTVPRETGALAGSLEVWDETTDRAVKRVGSRLGYALAVEARTGFMSRSA